MRLYFGPDSWTMLFILAVIKTACKDVSFLLYDFVTLQRQLYMVLLQKVLK